MNFVADTKTLLRKDTEIKSLYTGKLYENQMNLMS